MTVITIPKKLAKQGDLILIPRKEYEVFLDLKRKQSIDSGLREALLDVKANRIIGPFSSLKTGLRALKRAK